MEEEKQFKKILDCVSDDKLLTFQKYVFQEIISRVNAGAEALNITDVSTYIKNSINNIVGDGHHCDDDCSCDGDDNDDDDDGDDDGEYEDVEEEERVQGLKYATEEKEALLELVTAELKRCVPLSGEAPEEVIMIPDIKEYEQMTKENTHHVDAFIYNDDDLDDLFTSGKLDKHFCKTCGGKDIQEYEIISHSSSLAQMRYIYSSLVLGDLNGKTLVDVGSRTGSVLYSGFILSRCKQLIGIEFNPFFAKLQRDFITKKFKFSKRIKIIEADVIKQGDVLANADVVILNNVFEFFQDTEKQISLWEFLRTAITKKGCLIVTVPSLAEALAHIGVVPSSLLSGWVEEIPLPRTKTTTTTTTSSSSTKSTSTKCPIPEDLFVELALDAIYLYRVV
eukprot:TRINITY_DN1769_c0_g1_i2.p1 TRINITY_DN1769_c0_g1~~TRINITY_DN1769_c0_g1_i2.p1  ORF type:complete len:393 (-),score=141.90 TRINITY_DN1769_c0_g1_i2:25-1203(-)